MNLDYFLDASFITNIVTSIAFIALTVYSIKLRAKLIIDGFKQARQQKALEEKDGTIIEQSLELEKLTDSISVIMRTLNLIVQASKMDSTDKVSIMEDTTKQINSLIEFTQGKQERVKEIMKQAESIKKDPSQALELFNSLGGSILENYVNQSGTTSTKQ